MKLVPIVLSLAVVGCSTTNPPAPLVDGLAHSIAPRPMAPININCDWSGKMAADLERIIQNPQLYNSVWDPTFNEIAGTRTAQQRLSSAKTVLWTVRTRCPGF